MPPAESLDALLRAVIKTIDASTLDPPHIDPNANLLPSFGKKKTNDVGRKPFEAFLDELRFFLPDNLIVGALDLVEHDSVIKYMTPWGHTQYEVFGSTATYSVFPELPTSPPHALAYCTCPAYAYAVLKAESHLMCKHVLATLIAERTSRCVERHVSREVLAALIVRQCS